MRTWQPGRGGVCAAEPGFTLIELLIVVAIISIIASIGSAGLLRSRAAANEAGAVASVRVTFSSEKAYALSCGFGAYAPAYTTLGAPVNGAPGYISPDLGSVLQPVKSGYEFVIAPGVGSNAGPMDCLNRPTITAFYVGAEPISTWQGSRSFAITANGTVWQLTGIVAPAEPFGAPARPIQ
jgi:prepilin-type N-terminal cleavage/methylation domain-containing protein